MEKLNIKKVSTFMAYFVAWFFALLIIFKNETFAEIAANLKARYGILKIHIRRIFLPFLAWKLFLVMMLIITYKNAPSNPELYVRGIYLWFFLLVDVAIGLILINGLIPKPAEGTSVMENAIRGLLVAMFLAFAVVAVIASVFLPKNFGMVDLGFTWLNILILMGLLSAIKGMPVNYSTYRNIAIALTVVAVVFFSFFRGTTVGSGIATFRSLTNARLTSTLEKWAARQDLNKSRNYAEKKRVDADVKNNETRPKFTVLCSIVAVRDSAGVKVRAGLLQTGEFVYMDFTSSLAYNGVTHYAVYHSNPVVYVGFIDPGDDCLKPGWDELAASVMAVEKKNEQVIKTAAPDSVVKVGQSPTFTAAELDFDKVTVVHFKLSQRLLTAFRDNATVVRMGLDNQPSIALNRLTPSGEGEYQLSLAGVQQLSFTTHNNLGLGVRLEINANYLDIYIEELRDSAEIKNFLQRMNMS